MGNFIALLCGVLTYIIWSTVFDFMIGEVGKRNHLHKYYAYLRGEQQVRRNRLKSWMRLDKEGAMYAFNTRKYLAYAMPVCLAIFMFFSFFFRSWPFALVISLAGLFYPRIIVMEKIKKRKKLLNSQLKEAMFSLSASLRAGVSLQRAIQRAVYDLERIFVADKDAPIVLEFRRMSEELDMGYAVDEVLQSFAQRVQLEDVDDFVSATLIAKTRGGNLTEVLSNISKVISEKIQVQNEIHILTAGKRMEAKILSFMPIGIVTCLSLLSPQYMEPMFESTIGKALLLLGFILIGLNYFISRKIVNIDI
ncbi:MAG TPA: type II secretion system F family protein [Anaerovoracaceae bacterium]|nr:type II secretion system F family protein [Anaerovoracaceae bacterium]